MSDDEIKILITAVDNASKQIEQVKNSLGVMADESAAQTDKLSQVFDKTTGGLLLLGSTADRVDSIFSSYNNLQLRLENAQERVNNATDRYNDAVTKVNQLVRDGQKGSDAYTAAMNEQERASRALTISTNNQERAMDMVVGTYIQMGVSIVTVIASLPALITALAGVASALTGVQIAAGPIGWALLGITAVVTGVALAINHFRNEEEASKQATEAYNTSLSKVKDSMSILEDESGRAAKAINNVYDAMKGDAAAKSPEELQNLQDIAKVKDEIAKIDTNQESLDIKQKMAEYVQQGADLQTAYQWATESSTRSELEGDLKKLESKQTIFDTSRNLEQATLDNEKQKQQEKLGLYTKNFEGFKKSSEDIINYVQTTFHDEYLAAYKKIYDQQLADFQIVADAHKMLYNGVSSGDFGSPPSGASTVTPGASVSTVPSYAVQTVNLGSNTPSIQVNMGDVHTSNSTEFFSLMNQTLSTMIR